MCWQAQADQQAEHMRKMIEEKKRKKLAQEEGEGAEPHGKEVEPRGKWVEPHALPQIAQQCEGTGSVGEGRENCYQWHSNHSGFVLTETSSAIVFERPLAPAIKAINEVLEPPLEEAEHRRQWGEDGAPLVSLLQQRDIQNDTTSGQSPLLCVCVYVCLGV